MKKLFTSFNTLTVLMLAVGLMAFITACEGPEGPAGPAGADGEDGGANCITCHNISTDLAMKITEWETSMHNMGGAWARGTSSSCAPCHSTGGFQQVVAGEEVTGQTASTKLSCSGCHTIHKNYDESDFEPVTTAPVEFIGDLTEGKTFDIGDGNLCANCHQTRARGYDWSGGDVEITSTHWGPHHGPQSNLLVGTGFYTFGETIASSMHGTSIENSCVQCHMVEGEHTFEPAIAACTPCHSGAEDFDIDGFQTKYDGLFDELTQALLAAGYIDGDEEHGYHPVSDQTLSVAHAGALWNWAGLIDDGSHGVHNPKYIEGLLEASIAALK